MPLLHFVNELSSSRQLFRFFLSRFLVLIVPRHRNSSSTTVVRKLLVVLLLVVFS